MHFHVVHSIHAIHIPQLCLTAACQALQRNDRVLYIDTSNAATAERVQAMLVAHQDLVVSLHDLQFARVYDAFALLVVLDECVCACAAAEAQQVGGVLTVVHMVYESPCKQLPTQQPKPVSLLIIDSLGFLLAPLLMGDALGTFGGSTSVLTALCHKTLHT